MSGPFNVGDLVVRTGGVQRYMRNGTVCKIVGVERWIGNWPRDLGDRIFFAGKPHPDSKFHGWGSTNFRHLPKADEQFTAQMRAIKPARKQVSA